MQKFQIGNNEKNQRFDKYLKKLLIKAPSSFIYKMLRKKNITLNGKKADGSEKLKLGDEVTLFLSEETFSKFTLDLEVPQKYPYIPLEIIYEDKDILVINKPTGMLSQKAKDTDISANEYIIGYLLEQKKITEADLSTFHPSICNRLDRNTSGLLIAGKSLSGLQNMAEQIKNHSLEKYYCCLVKGKIQESQMIEGWLLKGEESNQVTIFEKEVPNSKYIETGYRPIENFFVKDFEKERMKEGKHLPQNNSFYAYTLLEVHLMTGRSHQIRAHLASIGHPIIGDQKYGDKQVNAWYSKTFQIHSQLLHAFRMKLMDGRELEAPLPKEFQKVINSLKKH
ncbi:MAG: RluA family pseudouridine synthase [Lachnospiraceae bacterium]